jgi:hypothetical protein
MLTALIHPAYAFMESIVAIIQASGGSAGSGRSPDADLGGPITLLKVQASRTLEQSGTRAAAGHGRVELRANW